jgi:hypothetical protein
LRGATRFGYRGNGMPVLLDDPYCQVSVDHVASVLRFTRTQRAYASLDDVLTVHQAVGRIFDRLGRERHVLLVDMRQAPLSNDPGFEQAAARGRAILVRGFRRVSVLVQTAVGTLQVGRHMREDGVPGEVFMDVAQALAYLERLAPAPAAPGGPGGPPKAGEGPFGHLARLAGRR